MKIVIIYEGMFHLGLAATERCKAYGQALEIHGHQVQIVMPFAFKANEHMPDKGQGTLDNVRYRYFRYLPYHIRKRLKLPIAILVFSFSKYLGYLQLLVWLLFARKRYDVAYIYEVNTAYSFLIRLATLGRPLAFEMCEIPFFGEEDPGKKRRKRDLRERLNLRLGNGFIAISQKLEEYLRFEVKTKGEIALVPILKPVHQIEEFSESAIDSDILEKEYVVHTGSMTQAKDGILSILEGIAVYNKSDNLRKLHFFSTGHLNLSPIKEEIVQLIARENLEDYVCFLGFLSQTDLEKLVSHSQMAVLYKITNEQNTYCFPTKLAYYLSLGIPVIVTDVGPMQEYIAQRKNGLIVPEGDLPSLVGAMQDLMMDSRLNTEIRLNAKLSAERHFSISENAVKLSDFFTSLESVHGKES